jgi:hypothetical protein
MSLGARPLRFLGAILGGWVALRVVVLVPDWAEEVVADVAAGEQWAPAPTDHPSLPPQVARPAFAKLGQGGPSSFPMMPLSRRAGVPPIGAFAAEPASFDLAEPAGPFLPPAPPGVAQLVPALPSAPAREGRLSGSAWLFVRDGGDAALAPGGELGGSQAGARLSYRLFGRRAPLALSGRVYFPLRLPEGAEAAVGLDWTPLPRVPVHILAERREALGRDGRSDFALTLYGGGERRLGPVRVEAWGQAGAVGLEDPDLFADGLVRATARVGPVDAGGGLWGGAQPGARRLDAGPHLSTRLRVSGVDLRLIGEWRFRIAGDAAPGSGPAFTIASDF